MGTQKLGSLLGHRKWIKLLIAGILALSLVLVAGLAILPAAFPGFGANMADFLRAIFGPQPVAQLESTSFKLHDALNRFLYKGGKPQIAFNNPTQPETVAPSGGFREAPPAAQNKPSLPNINSSIPNTGSSLLESNPAPAGNSNNVPLLNTTNVVTAGPQIGWQAYGPSVSGEPVMARTLVSPDPNRPYAAVALVRMDLSQLALHMMPGTHEPAHPAQLAQVIPDPGVIPPLDQNYLVAAFNGGFKAVHGHYGMMVDGVTLLPPLPGVATVAIYRDGHVQIGVWGQDIGPSPDMIAFRQNCPPLIDAGQINPNVSVDSHQPAWGWTVNTAVTWRTALGITQDGRYLIYAVGNGTSVATMAQVLQQAGAYSAMQLDVNQYYAHFLTFQPATDPTASQGTQQEGVRLLDKMVDMPHLYLIPNVRDFFYVTVQVPSTAQQKASGG